MSSDSSQTARQRIGAQLRFVFSLATTPPPNATATGGWREKVPSSGRWAAPVGIAFAAGATIGLMLPVLRTTLGFLPGVLTRSNGYPKGALWADVAWIVMLLGVLAVTAGLATLQGKLVRGSLWPTAIGLSAGISTALMFRVMPFHSELTALPFIWAILVTPLLSLVRRFVRSGRSLVAWAFGAVAAFVVLDVITMLVPMLAGPQVNPDPLHAEHIAPLWFPMSQWNSVINAIGVETDVNIMLPGILGSLCAASAFMIGCAVGVGRQVSHATQASHATRDEKQLATARAGTPARSWFAMATVVAGVMSWAIAVGFESNLADMLANDADSQFLLWAFETRFTAIMVTVLGLALALVGRGRPFVPAGAALIVLLIADYALRASSRAGLSGFYGAIGIGIVVVVATWWLGRTLLTSPPHELPTRRGFVAVAVIAAVTAPGLLVQDTWPSSSYESGAGASTPLIFPILTAMSCALLAAIAVVSALSARPEPLSWRAAAVLVTIPVLVLTVLGGFTGQTQDNLMAFGGILSLPFAATLILTMRWERLKSDPKRRKVVSMAIAGSILATIPMTIVVFIGSMVLTELLMGPDGGYPADGIGFMSGLTVIAMVLGGALSHEIAAPKPVFGVVLTSQPS